VGPIQPSGRVRFRDLRLRRFYVPARRALGLRPRALAFCKLAIEAQGGTIGVDAGVPAGSTFWFELPV
jgi:hypothetical protein